MTGQNLRRLLARPQLAICAVILCAPAKKAPARAASQRTPAQAVGEGRGARPLATDEQLVGVGQGVCALPSHKGGKRCEARWGPGGGRGRRAIAVQAACRARARLQTGGRARGGAHVEHVLHVSDFGGVEAQRLVERRRALPRVKRGAYGAVRGVGQQTGATASSEQWRLDCRLGTEQAWSSR